MTLWASFMTLVIFFIASIPIYRELEKQKERELNEIIPRSEEIKNE